MGDKLPAFGGVQTTLSQETVLASLSNSVKARGIKLLGILASDPWDVAFLVRYFHDSSPNVRLFVREADLLYLRTSGLGLLNGVLVINNFPLVPQNQFWTSPSQATRRLVAFPSGVQEALFNAFSILLSRAFASNEAPQTLEGGWPHAKNVPAPLPEDHKLPLWIAASGTTGYFPVGILNESRGEPSGSTNDPAPPVSKQAGLHRLDIGRPPFAAILVWLAFACVGLVHALALIFRRAVPAFVSEEFDFPEENSPKTAPKVFLHVVALLVIAGGNLVAGSGFLYFWGAPYLAQVWGIPVRVYMWLAIAVMLVTAMILGVAFAGFWRRVVRASLHQTLTQPTPPPGPEEDEVSGKPAIAVYSFFALIIGGPFIWWASRVFWKSFDNTFLHFRDLHLSSGVAPALPILFLLIISYLGIWTYLRRVAFRDYGYVKLPPITDGTDFAHEFQDNVDEIDLWMRRIRYGWVFLAVFVGTLLAFRPWSTMNTFELNGVGGIIVYVPQ